MKVAVLQEPPSEVTSDTLLAAAEDMTSTRTGARGHLPASHQAKLSGYIGNIRSRVKVDVKTCPPHCQRFSILAMAPVGNPVSGPGGKSSGPTLQLCLEDPRPRDRRHSRIPGSNMRKRSGTPRWKCNPKKEGQEGSFRLYSKVAAKSVKARDLIFIPLLDDGHLRADFDMSSNSFSFPPLFQDNKREPLGKPEAIDTTSVVSTVAATTTAADATIDSTTAAVSTTTATDTVIVQTAKPAASAAAATGASGL